MALIPECEKDLAFVAFLLVFYLQYLSAYQSSFIILIVDTEILASIRFLDYRSSLVLLCFALLPFKSNGWELLSSKT